MEKYVHVHNKTGYPENTRYVLWDIGRRRGRICEEESIEQKDIRGNRADPSAPIQLYFSIINAYIVTFVNSGVSKGRSDG